MNQELFDSAPKVLQLLAGAPEGGAETAFVDTVVSMQKLGVPQKVVMRPNATREKLIRACGLEPVLLPFGNAFDFKTKREIRRIIADYQPHVVQSWLNRATKHTPQATPENPFLHVAYLGGYYDTKYFRHADELVGVTQDIVDYLEKAGWPKEHAHYIRCHVQDIDMPAVDRAEFETPEDATLLLAMGRLHPVKAYDILLESMALLPDSFYLWIAGDGPLKGELMAMMENLGLADRVRFLGWRTDRQALQKTCDVCVFPSRYESFGIVMLEAWSQRRPLVAARAAGPAATITHEKDGLLVPIDDAEALAAAIRRIVDDPELAKRLVAEGRKSYERDYTEEAVIGEYLKLYEKGMSRKGISR